MQEIEIIVRARSVRDLRRKLAEQYKRPVGNVDAWVTAAAGQNMNTVKQAVRDWLGIERITWRVLYHGRRTIIVEIYADECRKR